MREPCETCKSTDYAKRRFTLPPQQGAKGQWTCNLCDSIIVWMPDVYFDESKGANQTDPNLVDRYKGPVTFSSKKEKAVLLKQLGLREAGDKEGGARNTDVWRHKNKPTKYFFT